MRLKIYGDSPHPDIAASYNDIGNVYQSQVDYESALDCYQKSLNMQLKIYGDLAHPDTATSYNNIGNVYRSQGDYKSALAWLRRGLSALPPGQSPYRPMISRNIQETEQTITKLVIHMVRAHQLLPIKSQSHSWIIAWPLVMEVLKQLQGQNSVRIAMLKEDSHVWNCHHFLWVFFSIKRRKPQFLFPNFFGVVALFFAVDRLTIDQQCHIN